MDELEDLLLGGDIDTVNEVLAMAGSVGEPTTAMLVSEANLIFPSESIPDYVFPKVPSISSWIVFSLKML